MAVKPVPEGYHTVTPYLIVNGATQVIEFAKQAFGAQEIFSMPAPDGKIGHAEIKIGDSMIMLSDACEQNPAMPVMLCLYVEDCDALYQKAIDAGATSIMPPTNQFYGDRSGSVQDSAGNKWYIATHVEDVTPEELGKRAAEYEKNRQAAAK